MPGIVEVAIIGAGPYGLSLAAHLSDAGVPFRIFGQPMSSWRDHMPKGMKLKSDGFASNLSAPDRASTLAAWCAANNRPYDAQKLAVALEDFVAYADWFTRTYVPHLERHDVTALVQAAHGYTLTLDSGETVHARRVINAVGITWFKHMPAELTQLPARHVSHAFDHRDFSRFLGQDVIVLGAGASAVNTAVALSEAGARATLVARRKTIDFHDAPSDSDPTILGQLQRPDTGIGPGWRSFFCANTPLLFHRLPQRLRLQAVRRHLGPAAGWTTRAAFDGKIPTRLGLNLEGAHLAGGRVVLGFKDGDGRVQMLAADHVVAATGYKPDLARLPFLDANLRNRVAQVEGTPVLSDNFESSAHGLYFVGLAAANSFGPLLRFMVGAEFAAPRLAKHLRRKTMTEPVEEIAA